MLMSEQICLTALLTLPKQQQLKIVERLQQSNQQQEDLTTSNESNGPVSVKKEKLLQRLASLTTTARMAILAAAIEQKAIQADTQELKDIEQEVKDSLRFLNNKIFTADKVSEARKRLKSKLDALNGNKS